MKQGVIFVCVRPLSLDPAVGFDFSCVTRSNHQSSQVISSDRVVAWNARVKRLLFCGTSILARASSERWEYQKRIGQRKIFDDHWKFQIAEDVNCHPKLLIGSLNQCRHRRESFTKAFWTKEGCSQHEVFVRCQNKKKIFIYIHLLKRNRKRGTLYYGNENYVPRLSSLIKFDMDALHNCTSRKWYQFCVNSSS